MKYLIAIALIIMTSLDAQAGFADLFNFKNEYKTKHYNPNKSVKTETIGSFKAKAKPILNISLTGNINLYLRKEDKIYYPLIAESDEYDFFKTEFFSENPFINVLDKQAQDLLMRYTIKEPELDGSILYQQSQLLLQEFLSKQIEDFKLNQLDMVFFTGNQVYSNNQIDHFYTNITENFDKYQIPHYEVLGANEARGGADIRKEMGDFYYLLQTKMTNIIVLNNLFTEIVADKKNLPYEASAQYIWLEAILKKLEKENMGEDLIVISYKEPSKNTINFIREHDHINLVAFIYGEEMEYKEQEWNDVLFISTPSLSQYPCSYLKINRDKDGFYNFTETLLDLPGIQEMAKQKL
jgi:hypothetical protein